MLDRRGINALLYFFYLMCHGLINVFVSQILMYLRMCLANSAGVRPALESFHAMQAQAPLMAATLQALLRDQPGEKGPVGLYIGLIRQVLTAIGGMCLPYTNNYYYLFILLLFIYPVLYLVQEY